MSKKQILHFGLAGPLNNEQITAGMTRESIQSKVTAGADAAIASGKYDVQLTFAEFETLDEEIGKLRKALESGRWDALVIGGALRGAPPVLPQFEQVVNLSREVAPKTKILFQGSPGDIYEVCRRGFES